MHVQDGHFLSPKEDGHLPTKDYSPPSVITQHRTLLFLLIKTAREQHQLSIASIINTSLALTTPGDPGRMD
jgi:hypothetical protein